MSCVVQFPNGERRSFPSPTDGVTAAKSAGFLKAALGLKIIKAKGERGEAAPRGAGSNKPGAKPGGGAGASRPRAQAGGGAGAARDIRSLLNKGEEAELLTAGSAESLAVIRHSAAHVLAQAVQSLFPDVKVTIGPVIENGFYYDFDTERHFTPEDLERVEKRMKRILKQNHKVERETWPVKKALQYFGEKGETLKQEIIEDLAREEGLREVSIYRQGPWLDLCRGPHVLRLGQIGAVKVLSCSGAYWRGDSQNKQLQRVYGTAFHTQEDLADFLQKREERAQNDHRLIGKKLDLFWFSDLCAGQPFFTAKGAAVYHALQSFLREKYRECGYEEIISPQLYHANLFERSGHLRHFADNMLAALRAEALDGSRLEAKPRAAGSPADSQAAEGEAPNSGSQTAVAGTGEESGAEASGAAQEEPAAEPDAASQGAADAQPGTGEAKPAAAQEGGAGFPKNFSADKAAMPGAKGRAISFLKPMNCPGHCVFYKKERRSYKDLPWRVADFGRLHRHEGGGALHGLTRVRAFCQDDAHIFCRPDQLMEEIQNGMKMLMAVYKTLGLDNYTVSLSTRPESRMGREELWDQAEEALSRALRELGVPFTEDPGEGAFYGPKLDISVRDSFSRQWQLGTFQCDFNLPEAFGLEFINHKDQAERPVMIHRAVLGSLERFIGLYLEHRKGRLPLWLCPVQAVVLPIGESDRDFGREIQKKMDSAGILCKMDGRDEKLSYKVRQAQLSQIPYMIVVGKREAETGSLSVRPRGGAVFQQTLESLMRGLLREKESLALHSVFSRAGQAKAAPLKATAPRVADPLRASRAQKQAPCALRRVAATAAAESRARKQATAKAGPVPAARTHKQPAQKPSAGGGSQKESKQQRKEGGH